MLKNKQFLLENASITSIKIPLPIKTMSYKLSQINSLSNTIESDLTELSWLTNNVQFTANNAASHDDLTPFSTFTFANPNQRNSQIDQDIFSSSSSSSSSFSSASSSSSFSPLETKPQVSTNLMKL